MVVYKIQLLISGDFLHPPLISSPHQSGFYGQFISHLTSLLSLNFEVRELLLANNGINKNKKRMRLGGTTWNI